MPAFFPNPSCLAAFYLSPFRLYYIYTRGKLCDVTEVIAFWTSAGSPGCEGHRETASQKSIAPACRFLTWVPLEATLLLRMLIEPTNTFPHSHCMYFIVGYCCFGVCFVFLSSRKRVSRVPAFSPAAFAPGC